MRRRVNVSLDPEVYDRFRKYMVNRGYGFSRVVEVCLKSLMESDRDGVDIVAGTVKRMKERLRTKA